jgi:hypothetical protein
MNERVRSLKSKFSDARLFLDLMMIIDDHEEENRFQRQYKREKQQQNNLIGIRNHSLCLERIFVSD